MTELVLTRRLPHAPERVWRAVSEPDELGRWMPGTGDVVLSEPPRAIAWENGGHHVRIDLRPDGDGTLMTFTHRLPGPADQFAAGWEIYFTRLDALLAGSELSEQAAHDQRRIALVEDGPELRLERRLFHPVDRLWRALTDAAELAQWFPGEYEVVKSEPPRLLVARWHGETLRFDLEPDGDFAVLRFSHSFAGREFAARTAAGWDRCFERLDALLRGGPLGERESLALWPHVHERYAEEWGVDPEIGRRAYAEHPAT
jgi:uncharacterized protein YndB with AHSA1/START domain